MMPGMDGITLLRTALQIDPLLVGIIMTGHGTIGTAVEAMQTGALDYILKPFKLSAILPVLARALACGATAEKSGPKRPTPGRDYLLHPRRREGRFRCGTWAGKQRVRRTQDV